MPGTTHPFGIFFAPAMRAEKDDFLAGDEVAGSAKPVENGLAGADMGVVYHKGWRDDPVLTGRGRDSRS